MFRTGSTRALTRPLAVCLVLLASAAWAAGDKHPQKALAEPADPIQDFPQTLGLPPYPGGSHIPMDGELSTGQVPLEAVIFTTRDPVEQVMAFYEHNLTSRNLRTTKHYFGPQAGYVGFFHAESGTMRLANVRATPKGTLIILSAMNPMPLLANTMQVPEDLPSLPSAIKVVTTEARQGQSLTRTVHFEAWGQPAEVMAQLKEAAKAKEWKSSQADSEIFNDALTLKRGRQTCIIRVSAASDTTNAQASSTVTMVVIEENNPEGSKGK